MLLITSKSNNFHINLKFGRKQYAQIYLKNSTNNTSKKSKKQNIKYFFQKTRYSANNFLGETNSYNKKFKLFLRMSFSSKFLDNSFYKNKRILCFINFQIFSSNNQGES